MTNKIIILSGPSGSGKTTMAMELLNEKDLNLHKVTTYTTRAPREGEKNGRDYHFITESDFLEKLRNNEFVEHAAVFGFYYGTSQKSIQDCLNQNKNVLLILDVKGHQTFRNTTDFPICSIFLSVPSMEELEKRLKSRNQDDPQTIARRLREAKEEMKWQNQFDLISSNDNFKQSFAEIRQFIQDKTQNKVKLKS